MNKVMRLVGTLAGGMILAMGSVVGTKVAGDRALCQESSAAFAELYSLNSMIQLQGAVPDEQHFGFKNLMKTKAVVLTKLREHHEMKADLASAMADFGLVLKDLRLDQGSAIPRFDASSEQMWEGELSATEFYQPHAEDTFQTQKWVAKIEASDGGLALVQKWIQDNKEKGNIAIIAEQPEVEDGIISLKFSSGMIPSMKMPKRVLKIDQVSRPVHEQNLSWVPVKDLFGYQACTTRATARFQKLEQKIQESAPKVLDKLESADKARWLWMASLQSKTFIDQARQPSL